MKAKGDETMKAKCVNCEEQKPLHEVESKGVAHLVCDECYKEQVPTFEVVWLCEPDEENWDGVLGGGLESPRPIFHTEEGAMAYINNYRRRTRAIIHYYELDDEGELFVDRHKEVKPTPTLWDRLDEVTIE